MPFCRSQWLDVRFEISIGVPAQTKRVIIAVLLQIVDVTKSTTTNYSNLWNVMPSKILPRYKLISPELAVKRSTVRATSNKRSRCWRGRILDIKPLEHSMVRIKGRQITATAANLSATRNHSKEKVSYLALAKPAPHMPLRRCQWFDLALEIPK